MNFEDMEEKIIANKIHVLLFCSPYNPLGRVWERWELEKMMELCKKHDVYVISDEIWADFVFSGHKHIPLLSISEDAKNRTIAMLPVRMSGKLIEEFHIPDTGLICSGTCLLE